MGVNLETSQESERENYSLIVLGGGICDVPRKCSYIDCFGNEVEISTPLSSHSISRVIATVEVAKKLREQNFHVNVIFTGGSTNPNNQSSEASAMCEMFEKLADPNGEGLWNGCLEQEKQAWDTRTNAFYTLPMIPLETTGNIMVITNGVESGGFEGRKWPNLWEGINQFGSHAWRAYSVFCSIARRKGFDVSRISVIPAEVILQELGFDFSENTDTRSGLMNQISAWWTTLFDYEGRVLSFLAKDRLSQNQEP